MASYKVFFVFECSPETHWGIENDDDWKDLKETLDL